MKGKKPIHQITTKGHLTVKSLTASLYPNKVIKAIVISFNETGSFIKITDQLTGFCSNVDTSDFVTNPQQVLKIGRSYFFVVKSRKLAKVNGLEVVILSFKDVYPEHLKTKVKTYPTISHFKNVKFLLSQATNTDDDEKCPAG